MAIVLEFSNDLDSVQVVRDEIQSCDDARKDLETACEPLKNKKAKKA